MQEIRPYFIGQDPGQIELLWNTVYRDGYRRPDDTLLNARECDSTLSRKYIRRILPNISMVITLFVPCPKFRQGK